MGNGSGEDTIDILLFSSFCCYSYKSQCKNPLKNAADITWFCCVKQGVVRWQQCSLVSSKAMIKPAVQSESCLSYLRNTWMLNSPFFIAKHFRSSQTKARLLTENATS